MFPNLALPKVTLVVVVLVVVVVEVVLVLSVVEVVAEEAPSLLLLQDMTVRLKRDMRIIYKTLFIFFLHQ